jgi:hypothetical protein
MKSKIHDLYWLVLYEIAIGLAAIANVFLPAEDLLDLATNYACDRDYRNLRLARGCLAMADRARRAPHLFMLPECRLIAVSTPSSKS